MKDEGDEDDMYMHHRNEIFSILSRFMKICYHDEKNIPPDAMVAIRELITGKYMWHIFICVCLSICLSVCLPVCMYVSMHVGR